jgi:uncharacterized membrane protein
MIVVDILIATLVLFPLLADGLALDLPGSGTPLAELRIELFVAALIAAGVWALRREGWKGLPAEGRARAPRDVAAAAAGLGALALLWRLMGFNLDVAAWYLSYGTGAVPLVALAAAAARRWTNAPWERSFFFRHGAALARAWRAALEIRPGRALWIAALGVGVLYLWVALARHRAFDSHGFDLGVFTNAMWNLTHGNGYVSSLKGGINLFADHQSPLFWVLAPAFWLVPRAETLLVAQAFGLAAGGPALFHLAQARLGRGHWAGAALPWLYWSYLPLRHANAFDFHPEVFMLPLFLWAFVGFASQRRWAKGLGVLAFVAALAAKESAPVLAAGIGIAWSLASARPWRERWPGIALAIAAAALFFFDVKVVPRFFGADYAYMSGYQQFGGGIVDVLFAPFTQPARFFSQLVDRPRLVFLFWTLAPLGFVPLLAWRAALAALPVYLMLFLSAGDQRVQIYFHYGIEPAAALFWALPAGLAVLAGRFGAQGAGLWILFWALACLRPYEVHWAKFYESTAHSRWIAAEALPCLDGAAPMAASDVLIPHLATRSWINYPHALAQPSGEPVSCVVTDFEVNRAQTAMQEAKRVVADLPAYGYRETYRCRSFAVYQRGTAACLRCTPDCR